MLAHATDLLRVTPMIFFRVLCEIFIVARAPAVCREMVVKQESSAEPGADSMATAARIPAP
eukprot:624107-Hanusia_phi.AAC.3